MIEQEALRCKFEKGSCIHCGDTTQGECEGWVQPDTMIGMLTDERNEWKTRCEFSFEQRNKLTAERDAYAKAADDMAAAHKVERDALKDAAKLASKALNRIDAADIRLDVGERLSIAKAIAALKAVL